MDFGEFQTLLGGWMFYALLGCLAALVLGAAWWAIGIHGSNPAAAGRGKSAVGAALLGALLVGGGPALVGFLTNAGSHIITRNVDRANGRIAQAGITLNVRTFCDCALQRAFLGERIDIQYVVINTGPRPVAAVHITSSSEPATCPRQQLPTGQTAVCTATHVITRGDLAAGHYAAAGTAQGIADDGTPLAVSASSQAIRTQQ